MKTPSATRTLALLLAVLLVPTMVLAGCGGDEDPMDEAVDAVKDAADDMEDGADDAADGVEDAADDAEDALEDAGGDRSAAPPEDLEEVRLAKEGWRTENKKEWQGYLGSLAAAPEYTRIMTAFDTANNALRTYKAVNGAPDSVGALETWLGDTLPDLPDPWHWEVDSERGDLVAVRPVN